MSVSTAYSPEFEYDPVAPPILYEPDVEDLTRRMRNRSDIEAMSRRVLDALGAWVGQVFPQTFGYRWRGEDTLDWGNLDTWIQTKWVGSLVQNPLVEKSINVRLLQYNALRGFIVESSRLRQLFETALEMDNETAFVQAAGEINWLQRPAADFARAVRLALATGAHLLARNLAAQGAKLYPDHLELRKMANVLAPPRVVDDDISPTPSVRANQAWLRDHGHEYKGQWVALREGTLLAAGSTAREVWDRLESTDGVMLMKVF
jgi:hypothetical protein